MGELGEKLVTKNYIALSELIKNSYDADATAVTISFVDSGEGGAEDNDGMIEISDNGTGLSYKHVKEFWMRIATSNKVDEPKSKLYGRQRTGNKGIGRFACQRLSRFLELETVAKIGPGRYQKTIVQFDWKKFKAGTELTAIPCAYTTKSVSKASVGFTLRLKNLRECWTQRDYNMLRRQVFLLAIKKDVRRKGYKEDPGFDIGLDADEFEKEKVFLLDQLLDSGWATLKGSVMANGDVSLDLNAKIIGQKQYKLEKQYRELKGLKFSISWIVQNPDYYRDKNTMPKYVATGLREMGGIRLYLDDFRIYPYGESDDDWLSIDFDVSRRQATVEKGALELLAKKLKLDPSRAMLLYPRHRSLIGRVDISSDANQSFVVKMDREGLIENKAFNSLTEVIRTSIDWMVLYYGVAKRRRTKQLYQEAEDEFLVQTKQEELTKTETVDSALKYLSSTSLQKKEAPVHKTIISKAAEVIQAAIDETDAELMVLRAVASTGPLMFMFAHEVKGTIGALDTHALYLEELSEKSTGKIKTDLAELAKSFRNSSTRFTQLSKLFGIFSSAVKRERKRFFISKRINNIIDSFGYIIDSFNINVDINIEDEHIKTPLMVEAEIYSVLVNLISNAIKAVIAGGGNNIKINVRKNNNLEIEILDNGIGLSKKYWNEVFEPLNSDPDGIMYEKLSIKLGDRELSNLGRGSGLGLNIVKGIVEKYKGEVIFIEPLSNWKTCIKVTLPWEKRKQHK